MHTSYLHELIRRRYLYRPFDLILDYADGDGVTALPTVEEYKKCIPNAVGWTTPTADCAFFTGLYLYGLCEKYDCDPSDALANEIVRFAHGLLRLCDVSETDGFIARAVGSDGRSHYPISSEDQVLPWLLGLWRLMRSPAADGTLRAEIMPRIRRTLSGLLRANFDIPSEWEGFSCSSCRENTSRTAAMYLYVARLALELELISPEDWRSLLDERPSGGLYTWPELVSHGFACDMIRRTNLIQFWIFVGSQLCIEQLTVLDPDRAEIYRRGLALNGAAAVPFMRDYEVYLKNRNEPFLPDWRVIIPDIQSWSIPDGALREGGRHNGLFSRANPARKNERGPLQQSIFGCWLGIICGDEATARYAYDCLNEAITTLDWDAIGMSYAFAAEVAVYCYQKRYGSTENKNN